MQDQARAEFEKWIEKRWPLSEWNPKGSPLMDQALTTLNMIRWEAYAEGWMQCFQMHGRLHYPSR